MANYKLAIPIIREKEGGKSRIDEPAKDDLELVPKAWLVKLDGVHTNKGIRLVTFLHWAKALGYEPSSELFLEMPDHIWEGIFLLGYWRPICGDMIANNAIGIVAVDFTYNSGERNAAIAIQRLLNARWGLGLKVDGDIGPKTVGGLNYVTEAIGVQTLLDALEDARWGFIKQGYLARFPHHERGLRNRLDHVHDYAKRYA